MSLLRACFASALLATSVSIAIAAEPAGRVLLAAGEVTALRAGQEVRLERGAIVEAGDQLRTGPNGHLQVRMTDEGILALRGNSALSIDEYRYRGRPDGTESAVFKLLKGGFRTITGLVGRLNRNAYRVETGVATIGIRGTAFALALCEGGQCRDDAGGVARDGLYGAVTEGQIEASNRAGQALFSAGETFFSAAPDAGFQRLLAPPPFLNARVDGGRRPTAPATAPETSAPESLRERRLTARTATEANARLSVSAPDRAPLRGEADARQRGAILPGSALLPVLRSELLTDTGSTTTLPRPGGFAIAMPFPSGSYETFFGDVDQGRYNAFNQLTAWGRPSGAGGVLAAGSIVAGGGLARDDHVLTWGRWSGGEVTSAAGTTVRGIPVLFVTSNTVPTNAFAANLPASGTVTYVGVGGPGVSATRTGYLPDSIAGRIVSESLTIGFGSTPSANLDMMIRLTSPGGITTAPAFDHTYRFAATVGPSANPDSGTFTGGLTGVCMAGCSGSISGRVSIGLSGQNGYGLAVTSGGFNDAASDLSASFMRVYEATSGGSVVTASPE